MPTQLGPAGPQHRAPLANMEHVDRVWRLSVQDPQQRARALAVISASLALGTALGQLLLWLAPPARAQDLARGADSLFLVYALANWLAARHALHQGRGLPPTWALHAGVLATSVLVAGVAAAYSPSPLAELVLAFYIWGSVNMYSLLSWRAATIHNLVRVPLVLWATQAGHMPHPWLLGWATALLVLGTGASAGWLSFQSRQHSLLDPLTECPNRRALQLLLEHELQRQARTGSPLVVATADLDDFKQINDQRGHQAGDQTLCAVVQAWRQRLRRTDVVARWGGDEFVLVLPDCDPARAQDLLAQLARPGPASASIGATLVRAGESAQQALHRADQALYAAKAQGKGRAVLVPPPAAAAIA